MEHLTKQQIVLLTLLVSFVTSIATGIVTVSLVEQAPKSVPQTINRIVEKTIERVVSDSMTSSQGTATVANTVGPIADVVNGIRKSLVTIRPKGGTIDANLGIGIIVSNDGVIVTDKSFTTNNVGDPRDLVAILPDGVELPLQVIQTQINGDIVFMAMTGLAGNKSHLTLPKFSDSIKLGQTVMSLSGLKLDDLSQGIIEKISDNDIRTSIILSDSTIGGPLFNLAGDFIGIKTKSFSANGAFYPLSVLRSSIPVLSR